MKAVAAVLAIVCIAATWGHAPEPEATNSLVVVTLNAHQWYATEPEGGSNVHAVHDLLASLDPDVIVLQETEGARLTSQASDPIRWLAWKLGMHHHAGAPMADQSYNVAVLSRMPLQDAKVVWLPAEESIERLAVTGTLDTVHGPVFLIATHFQTDIFPDDRLRQANAVRDLAAQSTHPVILAGDLNTEPGELVWDVLSETFDDPWTGPGPTHPADAPSMRIDHILTRGITPERMWTAGGPGVSDHLAVVAAF